MNAVKHISEIQAIIKRIKSDGKSIGFVPTMGALHNGHLALVQCAKSENNVVIVSIFVNPIQFNNSDDLKRYPRNLEHDIKLLETVDCDYIFYPTENEIYPEPDKRIFDFGKLDSLLEGKFRPGHFNGVAIVVSRLFDIITPDKAYFGEKDYQQLLIIKSLARQMKYSTQIVPCAIVREKNGLAMSSRNELLTAENREKASVIYKTLTLAKEKTRNTSIAEIKDFAVTTIQAIPGFTVEYFEICNSQTLEPIENLAESSEIILCIAVFSEKIRLIDNLKF